MLIKYDICIFSNKKKSAIFARLSCQYMNTTQISDIKGTISWPQTLFFSIVCSLFESLMAHHKKKFKLMTIISVVNSSTEFKSTVITYSRAL